jgi:hypothetical protein
MKRALARTAIGLILIAIAVWFFYGRGYDVSALPRVTPGQVVDFGSGKNSHALISGWGTPEQFGVWSTAKEAELGLFIQGKLGPQAKISFECIAFVSPKFPEQKIEIWSGRTKLADVVLPGEQDWFSVPLSRLNLAGDGPLILHFKMPLAVSPKDLGISIDARSLAFGLKSVRIDS